MKPFCTVVSNCIDLSLGTHQYRSVESEANAAAMICNLFYQFLVVVITTNRK